MENHRNISEFILLGLSYDQNIQILCSVLFLFCCFVLLVGNFLILISIRYSPLFHQPMCYFLSHLSSSMDICYTSHVTPELISDVLVRRKRISCGDCMLQAFSLHFSGSSVVFILTAMAFGRCVAICTPLHHTLIMSRTRCDLLVMAAWAAGAVRSFPQFSVIIGLPFCGPNEIHHCFCDVFPLLGVACTDTYITSVLMVVDSGKVTVVTFVVLFVSYVVILFTLRNHSAEGKRKALTMCGSYIMVMVLFLAPSIFGHLGPPTTFPKDKVLALFYTIIASLFNPFIYTLRNSEMQNTMRKVWCQTSFSKEAHN